MKRTGGILRLVLKERYKAPTLELMVPAIVAGNVFIPAYLERGGFQLYGLVLAFVPLINVSETATFALALRNVVFVTIEHMYQGYLASFLTMPVSRLRFFVYTYFADILFPLVIYWIVETLYLSASGILNPYSLSMLIIFTAGYLFSSNFLLAVSMLIRSPGASVLTTGFSLGSIFIGGGIAEYYLITTDRVNSLPIISWTNPYVVAIAETVLHGSKVVVLADSLTVGVIVDVVLAIILLIFSLWQFVRVDL